MSASYFGSTVGFDNKRGEDRSANDYYPTPPIATYALLRACPYLPSHLIWEPAAGRGHIVRELLRCGFDVFASDLHAYKDPLVGIKTEMDFLRAPLPSGVRTIITNPPYKDRMAEKFVLQALSHRDVKFVAVLCRMQFMNSRSRFESLFNISPPSNVLVFPQRINCSDDVCDSLEAHDQIGGMLEYCWYVWNNLFGPYKNTQLSWINLDECVDDWNREVNPTTGIDLELFS